MCVTYKCIKHILKHKLCRAFKTDLSKKVFLKILKSIFNVYTKGFLYVKAKCMYFNLG